DTIRVEQTETSTVLTVDVTGSRGQSRTITFAGLEKPPVVTGVTVSPDTASVQVGATQQFTAEVTGENEPSQAVTWSVEGAQSETTAISDTGLLTVAEDETAETITVTATSVANEKFSGTATVTVTAAPVETYTLTVNGGTGSGDYEAGALVTVTANAPEEGMQFVNWTADGMKLEDDTASTLTITMPANAVTLTANYEAIPVEKFTLTVNGGTGSGDYEAGALVTVTADVPEAGMRFVNWTAEGMTLEDETAATLTVTMPANAVTLTANYEAIPVTNVTGVKL
ncbi:InlB B-repeat-containing protein, partial [Flavonifractor hominis]